jgi:hypothetical protein
MADGTLTNDASWTAALRNVDLVIATMTEETAHSVVASSAMGAARSLAQQGQGPRLLPVRVAYEGPLSPSIDNAQSSSQYFIWRDARDNNALLRAMLEALAPAPSLLRLDGLYHHPLNVPVITRQWLRFFPDGRVAYKTLPEAAPEQAARWLSEEMRDGTATVGRYEASGNHLSIRFETERARNHVWRYRGVIGNNGLMLAGIDGSNERGALDHDFQFAAIAPPLRFDGMYVSEPWLADDIHPEKDWGWEVSALRFSGDGTLFYSNAWGHHLEQKKTPGERDLRGTYQLEDMNITISFPTSSGSPEVRQATIDGETIVLSGSHTGGYHFRKDEDA